MPAKPFIHRFATDQAQYIYDVSTNAILRVNDAEFALADHFDPADASSLLAAANGDFGPEAIREAWQHMKSMADSHGALLGKRPDGLTSVVCDEHLADGLNNKLRQLILNVTEQCNLRCKYCTYSGNYVHERRHQNRHMTPETALTAVDMFFNHSSGSDLVSISFYGGEPLLNMGVIRRVIEKGERERGPDACHFFVDTNGVGLTAELIDYFIKHQVYVQVSLDGPQEAHDRFRVFVDGRGSHEKVTGALRTIKEKDAGYYKSHVSLAITVAPPHDLIRLEEYFSGGELVPPVLQVNFVNRQDCDYDAIFGEWLKQSRLDEDWVTLRQRYIDEQVQDSGAIDSPVMRDLFEKPLIRIHQRGQSIIPEREHPNGTCIPGQRRLFVTVDGDLYMCERVGPSGANRQCHRRD